MSFTLAHVLLLAGAGVVAGAINAAAGGGSLASFPALVLVGLPALSANVTNTVALCFGYVGGVSGFRDEIRADFPRARHLAVVAGLGSVIGVVLIQISSAKTFEALVPWLVLASCLLLAAQPTVSRRAAARAKATATPPADRAAGTPGRVTPTDGAMVVAGAYGAYFGAGMGVMVLALLGLSLDEDLHRLNALKSAVTLVTNVVAALCFVVVAPVAWSAVAVLGPAALLGGRLGAGLAKRLDPELLRRVIVVAGVVIAVKLLVG